MQPKDAIYSEKIGMSQIMGSRNGNKKESDDTKPKDVRRVSIRRNDQRVVGKLFFDGEKRTENYQKL